VVMISIMPVSWAQVGHPPAGAKSLVFPWLLFHVLVAVGAAEVGHASVGVVTEVLGGPGADVTNVVGSPAGLVVSVQFPGDEGALCPGVPLFDGLVGQVVVFPGAQHVAGGFVQVVRAVLASVIVVVILGETGSVVSVSVVVILRSAASGLFDVGPGCIIPG